MSNERGGNADAMFIDTAGLTRLDKILRSILDEPESTHPWISLCLKFSLVVDDDDETPRAEDRVWRIVTLCVERSKYARDAERPLLVAMRAIEDAGDSWLKNRFMTLLETIASLEKEQDVTKRERIQAMRHIRLTVSRPPDTSDESYVALTLFLQWFLLMVAFPLNNDSTVTNFRWFEDRKLICVYYTGDEISQPHAPLVRRDTSGSRSDAVCNIIRSERNDGDTIRRERSCSEARLSDYPLGLTNRGEDEYFQITDGHFVLSKDSRPSRRPIRLVQQDAETPPQSSRKRKASVSNSSSRYFPEGTDDIVPTAEAVTTRLTSEQKRVLATFEDVVGFPGAKTDPRRRRMLVDGVAGSGKTFLLTSMLDRFKRVVYLVKKRCFVQTICSRFPHRRNLHAYTVDSFLMKANGFQRFFQWRRMQEECLDQMIRVARNADCARDDDTLYFVDEYTLIERSLADVLNETLRGAKVLLVGDSNQLSAIGDRDDQPIRTLLSYEQISFMYENVRARDSRLLARLSNFYIRHDEALIDAVSGLPKNSIVDMRSFVEESKNSGSILLASHHHLPRVIVNSNERVNFVNWAVGYILWRNRNNDNECLRYTREIVPLSGSIIDSNEEDDPYADELFVTKGLTYRIVDSLRCVPYKKGSRVVVREILSPTQVLVTSLDGGAELVALSITDVRPYEYNSKWIDRARLRMFPFVVDVATSTYQIQGITLSLANHANCYIDMKGMNERALYVALSRFENEDQIKGVLNDWAIL